MKEIPGLQGWRDAIAASFADLLDAIARYLPLLAAALLILAVGWLVSSALGWLARWLLRHLGVDRGASRIHLTEALHRAGIRASVSEILGRLVFLVLMLSFARAAMDFVGLTVVIGSIDALVAFLPKLIAAGLILLFGLLLGRVAGNLVSSGAATAGLPQAPRLGALAQGLFLTLAAIMALERVGIETEILVHALTALIAAVSLTMGVAFALGARPLVTHILAGHFLRQSLPADRVVEFRGMRGVVERVGPVDTVVRGEGQAWSIGNAHLLEDVVSR